MRVVVRTLLSLGLVAVLAAGCGSSVSPPEDSTADVGGGGQDASGDVRTDVLVTPCESDAECAARFPDLGPCRVAVCGTGGSCETQNVKNYEECDDGDACTEASACVDGACTALRDVDCDDGNACTVDRCAPESGCGHAPAVGSDCDDLDPCTAGESCDASGVCGGGGYICDPCTTDADCAGFEDGDRCNGTLRCEDGTCQLDRATIVTCDTSADPPCFETRCVPATGACERTALADASACEDGNVCTQGDACQAGVCVGGDYVCDPCATAADCAAYAPANLCLGSVDCIDAQCVIDPDSVVRCPPSADACAVAWCDPTDGACKTRHAADGTRCDDGAVCTAGDVCTAGVCTGAPRDCDDQNACTADRCDAVTGDCVNAPRDCDDQNACTTDSCDAATGDCVNAARDCDDQNACTTDSCDAATGACVNAARDCDDQNRCTTDTCDPTTGQCAHADVVCSDNDPCTAERCNPQTGLCEFPAVACDDQDPCTTDTCDPQDGTCVFTPLDCDDDDLCTADSCVGGQCRHDAVTCDDQIACTVDSCAPATGCVHDDSACVTTETDCDDDVDDDGDGATDCADPDCAADPACAPQPETDCDDDVDNDGDGATDCADPDCAADPACAPPQPETDCDDDVDNDGDGATDCADPDCAADPACQGCVEDELEDNDDLETATPLPTDAVRTGLVSANGDLDLFAVELCAGGTVSFDVAFTHANGDIDIGLFDPQGTLYAVSDGIVDDESITATVPQSGTWYLLVQMYTGGACSRYDLTVAFDDTGCGTLLEDCTDGYDNDGDTFTDCDDPDCDGAAECQAQVCQAVGTLLCGDSVAGATLDAPLALNDYSCLDWPLSGPEHVYEFVPGFARAAQILLTIGTDGESALRPDLDLLLLAGTCDAASCAGASSTENAAEVLTFNAAGDVPYFVVVDGFAGAAGAYELTIYCADQPLELFCDDGADDDGDTLIDCDDPDCALDLACVGPCSDDPFEENDGPETATPMEGAAVEGVLCAEDQDWFTILAGAGCRIDATLAFDGATADFDLYLLDPTGVLIGEATSIEAPERIVDAAADLDGAYYLVVDGFLASQGAYTLTATVDCTPPSCEPAGTLACGDVVRGTNASGTAAFDAYPCSSWDESGPEVVYAFVADRADRLTVTLSGLEGDLDVFVLSGSCAPEACTGAGDVSKTFEVTAGETYYVVVDGFGGAVSPYTLSLTCASDQPEICGNGEDDDLDTLTDCDDPDCADTALCLGLYTCENPLGFATPGSYGVDTTGMADGFEASCQPNTGPEAVFELFAEPGTTVCLDTYGTPFDTVLSVRAACDPAAPELACNDDGPATLQSRVEFTYPEAGSVFVILDGYGAAAGLAFLHVRFAPCDAVELCTGGLDDDGDGAIDCDDPDCEGVDECVCHPDAAEPNDTVGAAAPLPLDTLLDLSLCPLGDDDWFTFTLDAPQDLTIETSGARGDTYLELFDAQGALVAANDDANLAGGVLFSQIVQTQLPAGTYFVHVYEYGDDAELLAYTLAAWTCAADELEPDGSFALAAPLVEGVPQTHSICPEGDLDALRIELPALSDLVVETSGPAGADTYLVFYDAAGTALFDDDDGGEGLYSRLELWDVPAGTWFASVESFDGSRIPHYDVRYTAMALACPADDRFEDNDTQATATTIPAPFLGRGVLCSYDEDWFALGLEPGCRLTADLSFRHAEGDLDLFLVDAGGTAVAVSTGVEDGERIHETVGVGGRYALRVIGYGGASNRYGLAVSTLCPEPEVCDDGADNDLDELVDCADPDCAADGACVELVCDDLQDNDGDGAVDCDDPDCADALVCIDDAYEENDTAATAAPGPLEALGLVSVYGDEDWYAYTLCERGTIAVDIDFVGADGDLDLYLYRASAPTTSLDSSTGVGDGESVAWTNPDGAVDLLVRVRNFTPGSVNPYDLAVVLTCPELCANSADDDGDGAADCEDEDCVGAADCPLLPPPAWAQIQWPVEPIVVASSDAAIEPIFGRVYVPGLTEGAGKGFGVRGQLGWGPNNSDPATAAGWTWIEGTYESDLGNDDQFRGQLASGSVRVGVWDFAWRFTTTNGALWLYADLPPGTADGYSVQTAGSLTVRGPEVCDDTYDNDGDGLVDCQDIEDCAAAPNCLVCPDSAFEPDSFEAPTPLVPGLVSRRICPVGESDWFGFTLAAEARVVLETRPPAGTTGGDTRMWLFDAGGALVEYDDDGGPDNFSRIDRVLAAGSYVVEIDEYGDNAELSYDLLFGLPTAEVCTGGVDEDLDGLVDCTDPDCASAPACVACGDTNEPDSYAAPTVLQPGPLTRGLCPAGDIDYFRFDLARLSDVVLETSGAAGDTRMWLYSDPGVTQIAYNDDGGPGAFSRIERTGTSALPAGTYYVKVDEYYGARLPEFTMTLAVTPYLEDCTNGVDDDRDQLVDCADPDCAAECVPVRCPDDSDAADDALPLQIWADGTLAGAICAADNEDDRFAVVIPGNTAVTVTVVPVGAGTVSLWTYQTASFDPAQQLQGAADRTTLVIDNSASPSYMVRYLKVLGASTDDLGYDLTFEGFGFTAAPDPEANLGFEVPWPSGAAPSGYTLTPAGFALYYTINDRHSGHSSATVAWTTNTRYDTYTFYPYPVTPGVSYTFSYWVLDTGAGRIRQCLRYYDSDNQAIGAGTDFSAVYTADNAAWTQYTLARVAPANAAYARVFFRTYDSVGGVLVDDLWLAPTP
jgi:hypothetical protein